jgi:hypothetical protein
MNSIRANSNGRSNQEFNIEEWVPIACVNATNIDSFICIANMA